MDLFVKIAVSAAVCLLIFIPLCVVRNRLKYSFRYYGEVSAELVIRAKGDAESLEYIVKSARRELRRTPLISRIVIDDLGLSPQARMLAEILCCEDDNIYISEDAECTKQRESLT